MSHSVYSSAGSHHGKCHVGSHSPKILSHAYGVHHGKSHKINHGLSHISHPVGSNISHHGSNISHHGYSHKVHYGGGSHLSHHGSSHKGHPVNHYRAPSVHGGSGGKGISVSKQASHVTIHSGSHVHSNLHSHGKSHSYGLFSVNEKETMQHLNDRLASYLDKVRSLEQQNAQLERNIHDWYQRNQPSTLPDFSCFFRTIQELQSLISSASIENARIILQIDNARLAADDFRNKYEMERQLSNSVEADVNGLRTLLEELNREICSLENQVQNLQEELQQMKRNHDEEVNSLRAQLGARINVELDAAPSVDLNETLSEIRQQYENLMERNLREVEAMFRQRTEDLNREVASGSEQLQSVQTEVIDLKRKIQTLEIELQSQLSMKSALEGTLAETEATFGSQLAQLQNLINNVECQLTQIRSDLERQNHEYKILMDQKTHLEMEIATYKHLLEGHDIHASDDHVMETKHGSHHSVKTHHVTSHVHSKC
ncbi:keratin, type I cytoskeletal 19-like [Engystomops pustulosus]|uniref:keratin, type I cytoskeletal 19-like n=1 Tax=Engystomops pustulosus TaxID=76066 RepID=UPI003AFA309F